MNYVGRFKIAKVLKFIFRFKTKTFASALTFYIFICNSFCKRKGYDIFKNSSNGSMSNLLRIEIVRVLDILS